MAQSTATRMSSRVQSTPNTIFITLIIQIELTSQCFGEWNSGRGHILGHEEKYGTLTGNRMVIALICLNKSCAI